MEKYIFNMITLGLNLNFVVFMILPSWASAQSWYKYFDHFSCVEKAASIGDHEPAKGSALAGMKVDSSSIQNWKISNKKNLRPFTSDGCSMSPDGTPLSNSEQKWTQCCVEHDVQYWMGGTESEKDAADTALQQCISQMGYPVIGNIYKAFVKQFGGPNSTQTFRWGYGWNYERPYSTLSSAEEAMVVQQYGNVSTVIKQNLKQKTTSLVRLCDSYDYGLQPLNSDEETIFQMISSRVKLTDVIEWVKNDYFNIEKREYLVKLQSCQNPLTVIIFKNNQKEPQLIFDCENLQ